MTRGAAVPAAIAAAERVLTERHAEAVALLLATSGAEAVATSTISGFHGQTMLHRPAERWTWQIGDGAALARS